MKVVHLLPALEQGGVETVVCDLTRALGGDGEAEHWESVVVSKGGRMVSRVEQAGGRHVTLDLESKNPFTYLSRARQLRRILCAEKPDLVCVHSRVPAWLYVWANRTLGLRWITYAHGVNSVSRYSEVMTRGDLVVTPSKFLADHLKSSYGTSEAKIRVIPNAVDMARFDPEGVDRAFVAAKRREWGIREGDHVTMAIGRITPVKGLDGLIRDFAKRRTRVPNLKLVIVGGADRHHQKYLESLRALASSLVPDASSLIFAGQQTRIPECISIADEVVLGNTTKPETFGLSIVEAYAMNKPVRLARHFGGAAEVMDAVDAAKKPTLREAVSELYGLGRWARQTRSAYHDVVNMV